MWRNIQCVGLPLLYLLMLELNINQAFFANHGVSRTENPKVIFQNGTTHMILLDVQVQPKRFWLQKYFTYGWACSGRRLQKNLIDNLCIWGGGGCYLAKPDELTQWLVSEREELLIDTKNSWIEKWRRRRSFLLLFINVVNCFFNPLTLSSVMN